MGSYQRFLSKRIECSPDSPKDLGYFWERAEPFSYLNYCIRGIHQLVLLYHKNALILQRNLEFSQHRVVPIGGRTRTRRKNHAWAFPLPWKSMMMVLMMGGRGVIWGQWWLFGARCLLGYYFYTSPSSVHFLFLMGPGMDYPHNHFNQLFVVDKLPCNLISKLVSQSNSTTASSKSHFRKREQFINNH